MLILRRMASQAVIFGYNSLRKGMVRDTQGGPTPRFKAKAKLTWPWSLTGTVIETLK